MAQTLNHLHESFAKDLKRSNGCEIRAPTATRNGRLYGRLVIVKPLLAVTAEATGLTAPTMGWLATMAGFVLAADRRNASLIMFVFHGGLVWVWVFCCPEGRLSVIIGPGGRRDSHALTHPVARTPVLFMRVMRKLPCVKSRQTGQGVG